MLIHEKLPQGHNYPQITQTPATYGEFLDAFRGGHTIDDNLTTHTIAETLQAAMLKIAIASGHLKKTKGAASPNESLADIFLTEAGAELIQTAVDRSSANWQLPKPKRVLLRMMANRTRMSERLS